MAEPLVNKIAQSGIITLDLEDFWPPRRNSAFGYKKIFCLEDCC